MSKLETWLENKVVQNIVIWLFIFLIFLLFIDADNKFIFSLLFLTFLAIPIYINNLKILPLFSKKRKFEGVILASINILFFTILATFLFYKFDEDFIWQMIPNIFGLIVLALLFGSAIKMSRDSFLKKQKVKEAELKLLKAQLNPHFLFNTLNNLYGLSKVKSDKLPELMLKLSDLLRYSLYDTKDELVPLKKEIQYLENYISLERIRLDDKIELDFNITGECLNIMIAPMLLIVFVENAFKHLGTTQNGECKVTVTLDLTRDGLLFTCINTIDKLNVNYNKIETGKSGIGLNNAKKRLDLIYPNTHILIINTNNLYHTVQLKLKT